MGVVILTQTAILVLVRMNVRILVIKQGQICLATVLVAVCHVRSGPSTAASAIIVDEVNVAVKASKKKSMSKSSQWNRKKAYFL
jgi:hypothetical protein